MISLIALTSMVYWPKAELKDSKVYAHRLLTTLISKAGSAAESVDGEKYLKDLLDDSLQTLRDEQNRCAVMLLKYNLEFSILEYLSVGDMMTLHITGSKAPQQKANDDEETQTEKRGVGKFKSLFKRAAETKVNLNSRALEIKSVVEQSFFDKIHSDYVGKNSAQDIRTGGMALKKGDYIICINRGVADSLYPKELITIIEQFDSQPKMDLSIDLDIMAGVITQKAFNKIVKFDEDRPLVKKLKTLMYEPSNVSVDECFCLAIKAE